MKITKIRCIAGLAIVVIALLALATESPAYYYIGFGGGSDISSSGCYLSIEVAQ